MNDKTKYLARVALTVAAELLEAVASDLTHGIVTDKPTAQHQAQQAKRLVCGVREALRPD